jgi:CRP/FNR family transcriptional regulator, nitrogen oxide reductase regulator
VTRYRTLTRNKLAIDILVRQGGRLMPLKPDPGVIAKMGLFVGLEHEVLADVVRRARTRRVEKGSRIFSQGDEALTCYALIDGRVKIVQSGPGGDHLVIRFIGPGEMFGTLAVYTGGGYPADAEAVTDCVEISWSAAAMTDLMLRHPQIGLNMIRIIGRRLREVQNRLREAASERVERRIARGLTRLLRQGGRRTEVGIEIDFPLSRQDLAEMTGTTLHTVSRTLSAWEERGLVELGRRQVVIRDPHAIVAIAEDLPGESPPEDNPTAPSLSPDKDGGSNRA